MVSRFIVSGVDEMRREMSIIFVYDLSLLKCPSDVPPKQNRPQKLVYFFYSDNRVVHIPNEGLKELPG